MAATAFEELTRQYNIIDKIPFQCHISDMNGKSIDIKELPKLQTPVLLAGFDGWGNSLNVSKGVADYLVRRMSATSFGEFKSDLFFQYDTSRPNVVIENGQFEEYIPPKIKLYYAQTAKDENDVVILSGDEPQLSWHQFAKELFDLIELMDIRTVISIGSMYGNVLHTERIISGFASNSDTAKKIIEKNIQLISYSGPGSVHSIIHNEGKSRKIDCISLWGHCPFYIQGATHYGLISRLISLIGALANCSIDTRGLEAEWKKLENEIGNLIDNNPELLATVEELKKERIKNLGDLTRKIDGNSNIINLEDFLGPQ